MSSLKNQKKAPRRRFSPEFKPEALGLAEQVGVTGAAKQLGLHESQLYVWRKKARYEASRSETEKELAIKKCPFVAAACQAGRGDRNIKKGKRVLCEKPEVKYAYMSYNTGKYSISAQCGIFGVPRSGYYAWRHRQANPCKRQLFREKLDRRVLDAFHARKGSTTPI